MHGRIVAIVLAVSSPALATDRVLLDQCEKQLAACYGSCKAQSNASEKCNAQCTTDQCGLPWRESYGAFIDRRIEENANPVPTVFVGLKRLKAQRH
jgi:hypothetical protein